VQYKTSLSNKISQAFLHAAYSWINVETDQRINPFRINLLVLDNCAVCNVAVLLLFTKQRVFKIRKSV